MKGNRRAGAKNRCSVAKASTFCPVAVYFLQPGVKGV
jgi:hypothetical protein